MSDETLATGFFRLAPTLDGVENSIQNQFTGAGKTAAKGFSGSFVPALGGLLAVAGGVALAREVKDFVDVGVKALARIETLNAQTGAVIKSTGGAANVSAKEISGLADAIERTTATEAESIQQGANLLLTFKNIRNEAGAGNDVFNQTVMSMVDLARAMGTDASGGAVQLGKALNDPIKGVASLAKVGITFSEDQKAMIKSLVESNDLLGAQKIILGELNSQFGGSGAAYAATYAGTIEQVNNEVGNLQESLVGGLMPTFGAFAQIALDSLRQVNDSQLLADIVTKLNDSSTGIAAKVTEIFAALSQLSDSEGLSATGIFDTIGASVPELEPFLAVLESLAPLLPSVSGALAAVAPALAPLIPVLAGATVDLLPSFVDLLTVLLPILPPIVELLGALSPIIGFLSSVLQIALVPLGLTLTAFASLISSGFNLQKMFESLPQPLQQVALNVASFFVGMGAEIAGAFERAGTKSKNSINALIRLVNGAIGGLNDLNSAVGGVIGVKPMKIPKIPLLADGGTITRSGWAMVGEAGPELINMNAGAQVRPLDNLGDAVSSGGGFTNNGTIITQDVGSFFDEKEKRERRQLALAGIDGGPI